MTDRKPNKPAKPNGTNEDYKFISAGEDLSASEAAEKEKILEANPDDLACHLMLIGYYGNGKPNPQKCFPHLLWMIDKRPADYVSFHLNFLGADSSTWTPERFREASNHWQYQVKRHPNNSHILCNAASFFDGQDSKTSEGLYKRAKKATPILALPARQLAYKYRALAAKSNKKEQAKLVRRALLEVEDSLNRPGDHRGERIGLMREFTPTAIKFGHYEQAGTYAKRLQYYGQDFYLWNQYAYLYLAWLDLKENRLRGLSFKLKKLRELFQSEPTHVAMGNAAICFVNDAIIMNQNSIAEEILGILIIGARESDNEAKRDELQEWLAAVKEYRRPKLNILAKSIASLY